jgi:hypothetical protein
MAEHTQTPWEAKLIEDPQWMVRVKGTKFHIICLTSQDNDQANAEFIAKACNNYDGFVETLKGAYLKMLQMPFDRLRIDSQETLCSLRDAIAIVSGEDGQVIQKRFEEQALRERIARQQK